MSKQFTGLDLPDDFHETKFPPFGAHAGKPVKDVPLKYMDWAIGMWESKGFGNFMWGDYDDFFVNLKLYMDQPFIQNELEKEIKFWLGRC